MISKYWFECRKPNIFSRAVLHLKKKLIINISTFNFHFSHPRNVFNLSIMKYPWRLNLSCNLRRANKKKDRNARSNNFRIVFKKVWRYYESCDNFVLLLTAIVNVNAYENASHRNLWTFEFQYSIEVKTPLWVTSAIVIKMSLSISWYM